MTREEIIEQVNTLLSEEFEIEQSEFAPEAVLKETLQLDSINLVDLVALVQYTYKITIPATDLLQFTPIDTSLMVGNIDAVNLVALRITDVAIEGTPTKTEGTNKEIIEEPHIADDDSSATNPPSPVRYTPQQTHKDTWLTTASRTVVSVGRSDPLSANLTALYQLKYEVKRKLKRSYREWKGHMSF